MLQRLEGQAPATVVRRADYTAPAFWIDTVNLTFDLDPAKTRVLIVSTDGKSTWGTVGVSDNIIEASWLALVDSYEFYGLRAVPELP